MKLTYDGKDFDVMTYRSIRRAIGYLAISLPIILLVLSCFSFFQTDIQHSISHYYYTNLREIFTGTLCAVGLFLIRYEGHNNPSLWKNDKLLTNIGGIMAIGVAFIPTTPDTFSQKIYSLIPYDIKWLGCLHYAFAAILFLILALLAINVFTIGQKKESNINEVAYENHIYRFCGYSILLFMILIPICSYLKYNYTTLIFEALSLFAFGTAWLIKGRALGDKGELGRKLYGEKNNENTEKIFEE
ncbi:hypothetical protein [Flavobacterium notoginsengisoli]|uniref:hypothetical protein n=1 Tax=Flavobacterium notoginsengisoli TaxID=1478199 RepID=UPI0036414D8C